MFKNKLNTPGQIFKQITTSFSPIPKGKTKSWRTIAVSGTATITDSNGIRHTGKINSLDLNFLVLHSKFGQLIYGFLNNAWDQWAFYGGNDNSPMGSWIAMIKIENGEIYIGTIEEYRDLVGGKVLCIPHGFIDPNENAVIAATRELLEETGFHATNIKSLGCFSSSTSFFGSNPSTGAHSDEGFLVTVSEDNDQPTAKGEAKVKWMPLNKFVTTSYCSSSIAVASEAATVLKK